MFETGVIAYALNVWIIIFKLRCDLLDIVPQRSIVE